MGYVQMFLFPTKGREKFVHSLICQTASGHRDPPIFFATLGIIKILKYTDYFKFSFNSLLIPDLPFHFPMVLSAVIKQNSMF